VVGGERGLGVESLQQGCYKKGGRALGWGVGFTRSHGGWGERHLAGCASTALPHPHCAQHHGWGVHGCWESTYWHDGVGALCTTHGTWHQVHWHVHHYHKSTRRVKPAGSTCMGIPVHRYWDL